jgi:L-malate glycosyltransferase
LGDYKSILILADVNSSHTKKWVSSLARYYRISLFSLSESRDNWPDDMCTHFASVQIADEKARSKNTAAKYIYLKAARQLKKFAFKVQPDIVHAHYATSYGMLARKLSHNPTVISVWGSDIMDFPKRSIVHKYFLKRILNRASIICSTSKSMSQELAKYGYKNTKTIPFGVDLTVFQSTLKANTVFTIGTVKSLEKTYGIDLLIKVYHEYLKTSTITSQLVIYGKGSQEDDLKNLVNELNLTNNVKFMGFIPYAEVVKAYESLDVYCAFSRRESFGVSVLEAQACGLPVVCSDVGGLPEVVDPESGRLYSIDSIANASQRLLELEDGELREKSRVGARAFVKKQYAWQNSIIAMRKIYDSIT